MEPSWITLFFKYPIWKMKLFFTYLIFSVNLNFFCVQETSSEELASEKQGNGSSNQTTEQTTSGVSENPSVERENSSPKASKSEEQSETSISPDKTSKKPDKILPCPRCNSMDTKFCYFNNYNVNQPRHFCKNCQRYWTAGGTMRNVPVGAGRRKNKTSPSSHFRQFIIPDAGIHHPHQIQFLGNNGAFLNFGSDSSVSDNCNPNGFLIGGENGDDHSSKSSITASNSSEKGGKMKITSQPPVVKNILPFPPQLPSITGLPWPYPSAGPPPFCPTGFPVSYYSAPPYWGCTVPPSWTLLNHNGQNSFTNSSVLGKRSRDGTIISNNAEEVVKQRNSEEQCHWIPKTLEVDDPNEAAKSSIWSKSAAASFINGGGLFAAFQQAAKGKEENHIESCSLLQANPAAFSRALKFREIA